MKYWRMKAVFVVALCFVALFAFAACTGNNDVDPNENNIDETEARLKAPVLGKWRSLNSITNEPLYITFYEDGRMTSLYSDGSNALAVYKLVTWTYDVDTKLITMTYVDIRDQTTTKDFRIKQVNEQECNLVSVEDETLTLKLTKQGR